jgi:hypothetical protein
MLKQELHGFNLAIGSCFMHGAAMQIWAGNIRAAGHQQLHHIQLAVGSCLSDSPAHILSSDAGVLHEKLAHSHMPPSRSWADSTLQGPTHSTFSMTLLAAPLQQAGNNSYGAFP